jgi:exodeoxyribonuclease V beta subunit
MQETLTGSDAEATAATFAARPFTGKISRLAITASFSALNVTESELDESNAITSEEIATLIPSLPDESDLSILTFDRGRRTGDFFHDVLEQMDFQNLEKLSQLIESKLGIYGFTRTLHRPAIQQLLERLPEIELEPGMRLRDVPTHERLSECEFCHPLAHLSPSVLAKTVGQWKTIGTDAQTRLGKLRFDPIEGFLTGFIDLLFRFKDRYYLIDWKSNWLGNRATDYGPEGMRRAMLKHNYYLQYHLYTLAVDLFLKQRLPDYSYEKHFGGVFYIFLRGIDPGDSSGAIFRDRPALKAIEGLRKLIA